jgi:mono/diheme cytochrome c family protein
VRSRRNSRFGRIIGASAAAAIAGAIAGTSLAAVAAPQDAATKPATVSEGVYNGEQAKRGQDLYTQACSPCHLADLSGSDQAPSLAGGDFLDRWDGQSAGDLVDRIRTSMPADNVGSLNTQTSTDIVAYILQANGFPAGQQELPADRTALKSIQVKRK